jgi:hypothetical protein
MVYFADDTEEEYGFLFNKPKTKVVGDFIESLHLIRKHEGQNISKYHIQLAWLGR